MTLITSWPSFDDVQNSSSILEKPSPASSSFADQHERTPVLLNIRVGIADRPARAHALHEAQALRVRIQTHETLQTKAPRGSWSSTSRSFVPSIGVAERKTRGAKLAVWSLSLTPSNEPRRDESGDNSGSTRNVGGNDGSLAAARSPLRSQEHGQFV